MTADEASATGVGRRHTGRSSTEAVGASVRGAAAGGSLTVTDTGSLAGKDSAIAWSRVLSSGWGVRALATFSACAGCSAVGKAKAGGDWSFMVGTPWSGSVVVQCEPHEAAPTSSGALWEEPAMRVGVRARHRLGTAWAQSAIGL
ncbi:MAG: hypothetical protein DI563_27100 [Variovorax paradoxus]|uniref:Uncharacterized protein n=1 Tax=Variovorax paradoxus TaxID=34073 RepID=A0A2W5PDW9_VARPD|nr:MAG: hypothetical protein DI563_27100 [Variovorax paradoxus]